MRKLDYFFFLFPLPLILVVDARIGSRSVTKPSPPFLFSLFPFKGKETQTPPLPSPRQLSRPPRLAFVEDDYPLDLTHPPGHRVDLPSLPPFFFHAISKDITFSPPRRDLVSRTVCINSQLPSFPPIEVGRNNSLPSSPPVLESLPSSPFLTVRRDPRPEISLEDTPGTSSISPFSIRRVRVPSLPFSILGLEGPLRASFPPV